MLAQLQASVAASAAASAEAAKASRKSELGALLIRPTCSVSMGTSFRSPTSKEERVTLKRDVIDFYGLWASEHADPYQRLVYPMLQPAGARRAVPFSAVHLAHIWPSSKAREATDLRRVLDLPEMFHLNVRNFLILEEAVESAFDNAALLLLPCRAVGGAPVEVRSRALLLDKLHVYTRGPAAAAAVALIKPYFAQPLFMPRAAEGRVPFLRLLAWHAVSALRARSESDDDRASELPASIHADATIMAASRGRAGRAFFELASVGLVFAMPQTLSPRRP